MKSNMHSVKGILRSSLSKLSPPANVVTYSISFVIGDAEGVEVGLMVGDAVGNGVGDDVGLSVGLLLGESVGLLVSTLVSGTVVDVVSGIVGVETSINQRASRTEKLYATFISSFRQKFRKVPNFGWNIRVVCAVNQVR